MAPTDEVVRDVGAIFAYGKPQWWDVFHPNKEWPSMSDQPRDPLLQERQKTHGNFRDNALISQYLKEKIHANWNDLNVMQREALDMICLKMSRICSGQPRTKDHWDDIAGYAKLGSEACD